MAIQYPDVMNDLMDARHRFAAGCVQYLAEFESGAVPTGGVAQIVLTVQNTVDAPSRVAIHCELPRLRGKLRRRSEPLFTIQEPVMHLQLSEGEVGQVFVPVRVGLEVPPGSYRFVIGIESVTHESAQRARPERSENQAQGLKIRHPQGLGIAQLLSWGYETRRQAEQGLSLEVVDGQTEAREELSPRYVSVWTPEYWDLVVLARREVNDRRLHAMSELTPQALFVAFLRESKAVFEGVRIRLELGEAIFVSKMLTFTTAYFMSVPAWQDCLLVPILAYAQAEELPTADLRSLVTGVGYPHVLELAIALAFALVEEALGREPWQVAEQRALRELILQCQSTGATLPVEFLYLPLILGGVVVAHELALEGEDVQGSLDLLCAAKTKRAESFADPELGGINDVFEELLTRQMSG